MSKTVHVRRAAIGVSIIVLMAGAILWITSAELRAALLEFEMEGGEAYSVTRSERLGEDILLVERCKPEVVGHGAHRACLIEVAQALQTEMGALLLSGRISEWLQEHPLDAEVQAAGLKSIAVGRQALVDGIKHRHAGDRVRNAMWSFWLRESPQTVHPVKIADQLHMAELTLVAPATAKNQAAWNRRFGPTLLGALNSAAEKRQVGSR